jgi:hypothetical protein
LGNYIVDKIAHQQNQNDSALMLNAMQADVETWRLTLVLIAPGFAENLGKALAANRKRFAEELASKQAELELLRAKVSSLLQ